MNLRTTGLSLGLLLLACGPNPSAPEKPIVAVSVAPQAFFAAQLLGDAAQVMAMVPNGANPTTHEPTLRQLQSLSRAILYVKVGHPHFPFEAAWLDAILANPELAGSGPAFWIDGFAGVDVHDDDPHLWVVPRYAGILVANMQRALRERLPEHAAEIDANAVKIQVEIEATGNAVRALLADKQGQQFMVFHPAWGHFAREYGLRQVAIEEHGKEPDARGLAQRIREARAAGIATLFAQPQFARASAQVIAEEIGAQVEVLDPLAYAWHDNLRSAARKIAGAARP